MQSLTTCPFIYACTFHECSDLTLNPFIELLLSLVCFCMPLDMVQADVIGFQFRKALDKLVPVMIHHYIIIGMHEC